MASSPTFSRKIIAIIILPIILLLALIGALYFIQTPIPGTMDLTLQKINGSSFQTTSLKGHTLVIEFMATYCTYCQQISSNIAQVVASNQYPNVIFLSVSIDPTHDTPTVLTNFINENNFTQYALNGNQWFFTRDMSEQYVNYGVTNIPTTFLVNNNSIIVDHHLGLLEYNQIVSWLNTTV